MNNLPRWATIFQIFSKRGILRFGRQIDPSSRPFYEWDDDTGYYRRNKRQGNRPYQPVLDIYNTKVYTLNTAIPTVCHIHRFLYFVLICPKC